MAFSFPNRSSQAFPDLPIPEGQRAAGIQRPGKEIAKLSFQFQKRSPKQVLWILPKGTKDKVMLEEQPFLLKRRTSVQISAQAAASVATSNKLVFSSKLTQQHFQSLAQHDAFTVKAAD